ncbi:thiol-disulfide isomerase/thioredoxin [Lutibacter oceani]|uniref:Thiol-disulfide isomerase/thioredoxin n=1 Tax=Lutibacter oceani TaxID=1853311 RepID=A0A3D9RLQ9_9FLAO|nr:thioredoxin family protein [Lutibacter oceani]REE80820.1 thiol-disulfide isomerase/thioredoxin [Lutibacter oceani]
MKNIFFCLILIATISCSTSKKTVSNPVKEDTTPVKVVVTASKDASGNLIGIANKDSFLQEPYNNWFTPNYEGYTLNEEVISALKPLLKNITIKAFMGTWCGDSKQQTPILYKILDNTDFNYNNLELVTVNRSKKTPDNLQEGFNIIRVPTFIFYKNGKEIGRFVEYPRETVEEDMLKIVSGELYKHSYED